MPLPEPLTGSDSRQSNARFYSIKSFSETERRRDSAGVIEYQVTET